MIHLNCHLLTGRRYLLDLLGITTCELNDLLSGKFDNMGFFEISKYHFSISDEFRSLFDNPTHRMISKNFFTKLPKTSVPLEQHFIDEKELALCLKLLQEKPETSTHILLYGPPGTGKTSFAQGVAGHLGVRAYGIVKGEDNTTSKRRAAISACINMTNSGEGSLIVVDEADNLLNTQFSWLRRGETQDKGWLNGLLEEPGIRMIWITNWIGEIEESVLRRFSFSLNFRPFSKSQRVELWKNVLRNNGAKRFAGEAEIAELAAKYRLSPGAMPFRW